MFIDPQSGSIVSIVIKYSNKGSDTSNRHAVNIKLL